MSLSNRRKVGAIANVAIVFVSSINLLPCFAFGTNWLLKPEERAHMKQVIVSIPVELPTLDIGKVFNQQQLIVLQPIFQNMVHVDESNHLVGDLAKKWEIDKTGTIFTFELNNSFFSDGEMVTAEDVAFSLVRQLWPGSGSFGAGYLKDILEGAASLKNGEFPSGVKIISPNQIRIVLNEPYPPFLSILAMPSFSILQRRGFEQGKVIGSGPMIVENHNSKLLELKLATNYSGRKSQTQSLKVLGGMSNQEAVSLAKVGRLDVAFLGGNQWQPLINGLEPQFRLNRTEILTYNHLFPNLDHPLLRDPSFRKDLAGLLKVLVKEAPGYGAFQEYQPYFFPKGVMPPSYYNRARHLMSAPDFKSKWQRKLVNSKTIRLLFPEGFTSLELTEHIGHWLIKAGVPAQIIRYSRNEIVKIATEHNFDLLCAAYSGNFPDPDGFLDPFTGSSGFSYSHFDTSELRSQIQKIKFIPDNLKRLESYGNLIGKYEDEGFVIPMFREHIAILHNSKLRIPETSFRYESEISNMEWN